jgi:CHAT domain-containing protein
MTALSDSPDSSATPASAPDREPVDPELEADLQRLGLHGDLAAITLKREAIEAMSFASPVTMLPVAYVMSVVTQGVLGEEALGLGLRQTVRVLRPHGPSLLLGESLLSLSRACRMVEPLETRLVWILEALKTFRTLHAERRLGRGYIDLAVNLKDGAEYYDALHALGEAERACANAGDNGAVAAARYHRAHIYRMVGQPIEALDALRRAAEILPESRSGDAWRNQIRSERIFNHLILERLDDALEDLDAWIASGDEHFFPRFYRGDVFERRGDLTRALTDYGEAALRLAREILENRSDRFRRITALKNRQMFERAVHLALHLDDGPMAVSLLELLNTGARALLPAETPEPSDSVISDDALTRITREAAALRADADTAVSNAMDRALAECQERADLLLAERDVIGVAAPTVEDTAAAAGEQMDLLGIRRRIDDLLPSDAVLLEFTVVASEVWVVAVTHEATVLHHSALSSFELEMLKRSVMYECDGLLQPVGLDVLEKALLAPVEHLLSEKRRVVITLADAAYGIPFHAMRWEKGVLIDTHDVQYVVGGVTVKTGVQAAPSVTAEALRCHFLGTSKVDYADVDDLPGVESECSLVKELVATAERRIDLPATSAALFEKVEARTLHVACHGRYEERAPLMSRLLFSDRPVFAFEVALGQFSSEIAIIAGCQTASAKVASGGYVQSLATAFQRAGVQTVLASLWAIDDESSAELMRAFYEGLRADRSVSPIAAFCSAQRALRARAAFEDPWYWAPFVIFEDLTA